MEQDNECDRIRIASHQTGIYVMCAVASCFNRNSKYPELPFGMEDRAKISEDEDAERVKPLTDAEKFEMFMKVHNAQLREKRAKKMEKAGE